MPSRARETLLRSLYAACDPGDSDRVVPAMSPDVDLPNGGQGAGVVGRDGVRRYWEQQWREIRPVTRPTTVTERSDGSVEVGVHLVVRDPAGSILDISDVRHVYTFDGDLVRRMDVEPR